MHWQAQSRFVAILFGIFWTLWSVSICQQGFDVQRHSIPLDEIEAGGPAKDEIPSLTNPKFVDAGEADKFLTPWDRVLGLDRSGTAKAYPVRILNWHEIVNDTISGQPIMVSW